MLHSAKLVNKILIILMALLLLFNTNYGAFKTSEAHANSLTATFEEWASATYAGVVTGTMALATGAMHTQEYLLDNVDAMYQTAKDSWKTMAPEMKQNFLSSLNQMQDRMIIAGDWITGALDVFKGVFGSTVDLPNGSAVYPNSGQTRVFLPKGVSINIESRNGQTLLIDSFSTVFVYTENGYCGNSIQIKIWDSYKNAITSDFTEKCTSFGGKYTDGLAMAALANNIRGVMDLVNLAEALGLSVTTLLNNVPVQPSANTYNRLDEWVRERAIPNGQLGVYNPGAQAYTPDGYRLGLSTDGQTLLQLPDGIPWEGVADWKQPLLNTIDGTTAALDTAVGSWIDVATGKKIRDATVPEMASGTGVDESTAEYVLIRAKEEEKAREDKGSGEVENLSRAQKRNLETLDNIVEGHLKDSDFTGTLRDLQGDPVPKRGGGYWNHLKEMKDSYKGLNKIKKGLEGSLKNPNLNETERKILQEALDKVNRYTKKIEDLFSGYGGIKKMSISKSIGEIYNLPAPQKNDEFSLEQWYMEFYNKQIDDISTMDVIRMLEQNILEELAINKAIEYLREDPLAGSKFDGQLMETLLSTDLNKLNDSIGDIKKMVTEVSLKLNELDWLSEEDMEEYSGILRVFQEKVAKK